MKRQRGTPWTIFLKLDPVWTLYSHEMSTSVCASSFWTRIEKHYGSWLSQKINLKLWFIFNVRGSGAIMVFCNEILKGKLQNSFLWYYREFLQILSKMPMHCTAYMKSLQQSNCQQVTSASSFLSILPQKSRDNGNKSPRWLTVNTELLSPALTAEMGSDSGNTERYHVLGKKWL